MKREKLKREEEFKKLKIRKTLWLKFSSISKKPTILTQTKSSEIHFSGKPINPNMNLKINENDANTLNVTFGNGNNSSGEQNNQSNENKSDININYTTKKENLNLSLFNKNSTMSLMSNDINNFFRN